MDPSAEGGHPTLQIESDSSPDHRLPHEGRRGHHVRPSLISVAVVLILAIFTIVGYTLTEHDSSQHEQALLQNATNQAAFSASGILGEFGNSLGSLAAVVTATNGNVAAFEQTQEFQGFGKFGAIALLQDSGSHYTLAAGSNGFPNGALSPTTLALVKQVTFGSTSTFVAGPVSFDGKLTTARFAIGTTAAAARYVIFVQFTLNPSAVVTSAKPFSELNYLLYGPGPTNSHDLFVSSIKSLSLTGQIARATVDVGTSKWTLVASARHPFIGGYVQSLSMSILILGLLVALIAGGTIEILHRRHRYSQRLVEEKTADLEQSLRNLEEAQDALVRGERLTAVGEMAMVVGHELRNPLAAVTNALYLIRNAVGDPVSEVVTRNLAMAERETHKAAALTENLTAFVRPREMEKTSIPVEGLVEEVLSVTPLPSGVELITDVETSTLIGDRGQMAEVLTNLVTNAYEAIPGGGTLRIHAGHVHDGVQLVVEDSGPGIDESVANRVFEPFFTTKYKGTGLGLAIVHRLVVAHGGSIEFGNVDGGGARVTVLIPDHPDLVKR